MTAPIALVLRALGLGDFMTGLPAVKLIRSALPEHRVVLAAGSQFGPLIELTDYIDELLPSRELAPLGPVGGPIDVALDLHGKGPASRELLTALGPARLIGFGDPAVGLAGPAWRPDEHEVQRWVRLIASSWPSSAPSPQVLGCVARPDLDVEAGLTVLHPGAAYPSRRWPLERFAYVGRALAHAGHELVVTGTAAEGNAARWLAGQTGARLRIDASLREVFALVASSRLVISGDTGIAHVAFNYGIASVTLYGPVSPAAWGPPMDPRHQALFHGDGRGDPHGRAVDRALLRISPQEVLDAIWGITQDHIRTEDRTRA